MLNSIAEIGAEPVTVRNSTPDQSDSAALQLVDVPAVADVDALHETGSMPSWWGGMTFSSVLT